MAVRTFCAFNMGQANDVLARHAKGDTMPQDETAAPEEVSMPNAPAPAPLGAIDWRTVIAILGVLGIGSGGMATLSGSSAGAQSAAAVSEVKSEVAAISKTLSQLDKNVALLTQAQQQLTRDLDECSCTPSER